MKFPTAFVIIALIAPLVLEHDAKAALRVDMGATEPSNCVTVVDQTKAAIPKPTGNQGKEERQIQIKLVAETQRLGELTFWLVIATGILGAAAIWQAIISRNTARRQLRAYVSVVSSGTIPNNINPEFSAFQVKIKNSGQTPAYELKSWRGIGIHEVPLANRPKPMPLVSDTDVVLGAQGESVLPIRRRRLFEPEDLAKVQAGTHAIYVFGSVEYRDTFKKLHHTNFCLYVADGGPDAGLKQSHIGNDAD